MREFINVLGGLDYSPLWISVKTALAATLIAFGIGVYAANAVMKMKRGPKVLVDSLLTLPMVLPPTAMGFLLLLIFSKKRLFGMFLYDNFGIKVVQSWLGCVIAAVIVAFPLMYKNARAAFEQVDENLIFAARTLGMSEIEIFWKILVPNARQGVAAGTILTFARALGEYGATTMLAGNIPGKTGTISQRIAMVIQDGDYITAGIWVAVVMLIAMVIVAIMNIAISRQDKCYEV